MVSEFILAYIVLGSLALAVMLVAVVMKLLRGDHVGRFDFSS